MDDHYEKSDHTDIMVKFNDKSAVNQANAAFFNKLLFVAGFDLLKSHQFST